MNAVIKRTLIVVLVLGLVGSLWINLRNSAGLTISHLQGKTHTLKRDDLQIPITATGEVVAKDSMDIKSEAGGTVIETPYQEGDPVKTGDMLVKLDPDDEQRMVDIATKALEQSKINLSRSKTTHIQRRDVDLPNAEARLDQAKAEFDYLEFQYNKTKQLLDQGHEREDSWRQVSANYLAKKAHIAQLKAEVERAKSNIKLAELEVQQIELAVQRAEDDLADARERLDETIILAPTDGMLLRMLVDRGSVIVSGSRSLTGGTPLAILADVSEFYIRALVDEADIGRVLEIAPPHARPGHTDESEPIASASDELIPIKPETPVTVTVETFPDEQFDGVIDLIEPEPDRGQVVTSYVVRIRLTSEDILKPLLIGMQANVTFISESLENVVLVPNEAVHYVGGQRGVYLQVDSEKTPGKKVPRFEPFRAGLDNGLYTQVVNGLEEGQVVYTRLPRNRYGQEVVGDE